MKTCYQCFTTNGCENDMLLKHQASFLFWCSIWSIRCGIEINHDLLAARTSGHDINYDLLAARTSWHHINRDLLLARTFGHHINCDLLAAWTSGHHINHDLLPARTFRHQKNHDLRRAGTFRPQTVEKGQVAKLKIYVGECWFNISNGCTARMEL